jgi:hypothetical protein
MHISFSMASFAFRYAPMVARWYWGMKIIITSPQEGESVPYRREVTGIVVPALSKVQIFVHSGDNMWYRQPQPSIDGSSWKVSCYFGNEQSTGIFRIVALDGTAIFNAKITQLPQRIAKSKIITVSRLPAVPAQR